MTPKGQVYDPVCLRSIILTTVGYSDAFTMQLLQKIEHGISNAHLPDDVM